MPLFIVILLSLRSNNTKNNKNMYKIAVFDRKNKCAELFTSFTAAAKCVHKSDETLKKYMKESKIIELPDFIVVFNINYNKIKRGNIENFMGKKH